MFLVIICTFDYSLIIINKLNLGIWASFKHYSSCTIQYSYCFMKVYAWPLTLYDISQKKRNWILWYGNYLQGKCMQNLDFELKSISPFYDAIPNVWKWIPYKWKKFIQLTV